MRFASRAAWAAQLVVCLVALHAADAHGQGKAPADSDVLQAREAARALALKALAQIDAGKHAEGIKLLEQAEAKFHAPTHLLYLAQAHAALGHAALAAQTYDALTREELPNYAPDEFREAKRLGGLELSSIQPRVGRLRLIFVGAPPTLRPQVKLDGSVRQLAADIVYVDAGEHEVEVSFGESSRVAKAAVASGELRELIFAFENADSVPGPDVPGSTDDGPPFLAPGVTLLAVGGVGLVVGGVTGVLSMKKVDELTDKCPDKVGCNPADQDLADSARLLGDVSTAMFVIGGAAAVAGAILVAIPGAPSPPKGAYVRPTFGPLFVGAEGRF